MSIKNALPNQQFRQALRDRVADIKRVILSESTLNRDIDTTSDIFHEQQILTTLIEHYKRVARKKEADG